MINTQADPQFRLFIVGSGFMAKAHSRAAIATGRVSEIHSADPDRMARKDFQSEFPKSFLYDRANTMLSIAPAQNDIVVIATPPWLHESYVDLALRSHRNVISESPLFTSREATKSIQTTLSETQKTLFACGGRFLNNPATQKVASLVQQHQLGEIYSVKLRQCKPRMRFGIELQPESKWFADVKQNGGGCLMDWGPYDLANLDYVLAPKAISILHVRLAQPELPKSSAHPPIFDVESHAIATLIYHLPDESQVQVHYERATGSYEPERNEATITGTRGSAEWTLMGSNEPIQLLLRDAQNESTETFTFKSPGELWSSRAPLWEALKKLKNQPRLVVADGDALFQSAVLSGLYESAASGKPHQIRRCDFSDRTQTA